MTRLLVGIILGSLLGAGGAWAAGGYSVAGRLSATEQEAQEGYFAIDQQTMLVVKPNSPIHGYLRGQVGRQVKLAIETE